MAKYTTLEEKKNIKNPWTRHVHLFAHEKGISYACALGTKDHLDELKRTYTKVTPKVKSTKKPKIVETEIITIKPATTKEDAELQLLRAEGKLKKTRKSKPEVARVKSAKQLIAKDAGVKLATVTKALNNAPEEIKNMVNKGIIQTENIDENERINVVLSSSGNLEFKKTKIY